MSFNTLISILGVGAAVIGLIFAIAEQLGRSKGADESIRAVRAMAQEDLPAPTTHAEATARAERIMKSLGQIPLSNYYSDLSVRKDVDEALNTALEQVTQALKQRGGRGTQGSEPSDPG